MNTILLVFQNICVGKVKAHHQHIGGLEIQRYIAVMQITVMIEQFQEFGHMNNQMIEKVARVMAAHESGDPEKVIGPGNWKMWQEYRSLAEAALSAYNPDERLREALEAAFHEALQRYPDATGALVFMWAASGAAGREPTEEQLEWARSKVSTLSLLPQGDDT